MESETKYNIEYDEIVTKINNLDINNPPTKDEIIYKYVLENNKLSEEQIITLIDAIDEKNKTIDTTLSKKMLINQQDLNGMTPLKMAIQTNNTNIVEKIIGKGANVNGIFDDKLLKIEDTEVNVGPKPLKFAVINGSNNVILQKLIQNCAKVDVSDLNLISSRRFFDDDIIIKFVDNIKFDNEILMLDDMFEKLLDKKKEIIIKYILTKNPEIIKDSILYKKELEKLKTDGKKRSKRRKSKKRSKRRKSKRSSKRKSKKYS